MSNITRIKNTKLNCGRTMPKNCGSIFEGWIHRNMTTLPTIESPHSIGSHSSWCISSYHTHSVATAELHLVLLGVDKRLIS